MKRLLASTAIGMLVAMGAARADEVRIKQNFDLADLPQTVVNLLVGKHGISGAELSALNVQNLIQWRDASEDRGLYGDIYVFDQFTDEEQAALNVAVSPHGNAGASLSATNLQNIVNIEDRSGGTRLVGDHILITQRVTDNTQIAGNTLVSGPYGNVYAGSSGEAVNLANVANVVDQYGGRRYGNVISLRQTSVETTQIAGNTVVAGRKIHGFEGSALNGVNIASFDLSDQTGKAEISLTQKTVDLTQIAGNTVVAGGQAKNVVLSGTNLGNVVTFSSGDGS